MSFNIRSFEVGSIFYQSGKGYPTHIATKGCIYIDVDTAIEYINKDGLVGWVTIIDTTYPLGTIAFTGGTVNGPTNFTNGLTANTMTSGVYYGDGSNLTGIAGSIFTGGTVTGPTRFTNGLTANTISATTYYNLPTDIRITGGTYSTGTTVFTNNTGGTFSVTGFSTSTGNGTTFTGGTVSGATIFTNGLTANTISSTTYLGLPVSGVTGSTGISANTTNGLVTIVNTSPDQIVTITGGTNININGTYPNFGINFTGSTGVSGDFLPLSGGTVTGGTIFTNGLTANTISATSINKVDYIVFNTGTTSAATVAGTVYFDNTEKALSYNTSINQGVTVNLGQQNYLRVFNNSGLDIQKGKGIELLSSFSGLPAIALAVNRHYNDKDVVGVSAEIIPNNSEGIVLTYGIISNITVTGASIGSLVYASDTNPGEFKNATEFLNFPLTARTNAIGYIIQTGTTTGKLFVNPVNENNNLSLTDLQRNILEGNVISTGVFSFGGISLASSSTFNVGPAEGWIVDNTTNPLVPDVFYVKYTGQTNIPSLYYSSATQTYLLLTSAGTLTQQVTYPTPQQRRQSIYLAKMGHGNRTSLINAFNEPDFEVSPISQIRDMFTPIKLINENVYPSPNTGLTFNTSSGILWGLGIGFATDVLNPSSITISGNSPTTFQYRTQTGGTASNITIIDPANYDLNGVITTIGSPAKQATNQRVYLLQNGQIRIQYGQTKYADLTAAIAAVNTEAFKTFSNFRDNAVLIAILSVRSDASLLSDIAQAKITFASKFGESVGGTGGVSTTNLQQAYNNSAQPEIVTNSAEGALSIKNGTGNADNVTRLLEGINSAGNATSFIRADGDISGTTIQTNGFTANSGGLTATTISATTYQNLPSTPFLPLSGGTVTGGTIFTNGLTANTISATTYQNLPIEIVNGTNLFSVPFFAGNESTNVSNSNFFGSYAGFQSNNSSNTNIIGYYAGFQSNNSVNTNMIGNYAGFQSPTSINSNFLGDYAGFQSQDVSFSNFIGHHAGLQSPNITNSNFIGQSAGKTASGVNYSNFFGNYAGQSASSAYQSNFLGDNAGQGATGATNSNFFGERAGKNTNNTANSNFLGQGAGQNATAAYNSNFLGQNAGLNTSNAYQSNFFGQNAGESTSAYDSNFIGFYAGNFAINAYQSTFIGTAAGQNATYANDSTFIGYQAGQNAPNTNDSVFIGNSAGYEAISASSSNFLGNYAGYRATNAANSNFLGKEAGNGATNAYYSNFIGSSAGLSATGASNSNFFGIQAGQNATGAANSNFFGNLAGSGANSAYDSNFFGQQAGNGATNAYYSNFLGKEAGYEATSAYQSNFLGWQAGKGATNAADSNFLGWQAGINAQYATYSNFLGYFAGLQATYAANSNFLGKEAGYGATGANNSNFMGQGAGKNATGATNSNFIGQDAGNYAPNASFSNFIGYKAGAGSFFDNVGSNNIIIGTNISLPSGATDSINIGGVIFGTGTYSNTTIPSVTAQTNGKIGINVVAPTEALHVSGNTRVSGGLTATTISATSTINSGTLTTTTINGSNNQSAIVVSGRNTIGGTGYTDFIKVTNTAAGATNINKTIRVNNTGAIEFINSTYTATTFSISDNGIVTITGPASVTSNSATNNALNIGSKGQLFDDGNFHIHSSSGAVWINALDGSAIRLGTQTNTGNSTVIVDTTTVGHSFFTKVQSGFNVAFGTEITMDNLKVRINGTGGSNGLVQAGAVSGSFAAYTTLLGNVAGSAVQGDTNSAGITFTTTYQNISGIQKTLSAGGDTTTLHLIDTTNSRIYRITAIHCQGTTGGYTSIERMA